MLSHLRPEVSGRGCTTYVLRVMSGQGLIQGLAKHNGAAEHSFRPSPNTNHHRNGMALECEQIRQYDNLWYSATSARKSGHEWQTDMMIELGIELVLMIAMIAIMGWHGSKCYIIALAFTTWAWYSSTWYQLVSLMYSEHLHSAAISGDHLCCVVHAMWHQ
jgi:hypothetical protein